MLLAETNEGYHNLIKLVSAGYTEGFYYKPRIDKELLAQHATGLIGLSSCLKGEVATGIRTEQQHKAVDAAAAYRDILGAENFFLEMQYQGIDDQRVVNIGLPADRARPRPAARLPPTTSTTCSNSDYKPHDVLLCIGTGKSVNDTERLRYHGDQFFLKTAEEMAQVFGDFPDALAAHRAHRRALQRRPRGHGEPPARTSTCPPGFTLDGYFEHVVREGFAERLPRLQRAGAPRRAQAHHRRVRAAARRTKST